MHNLEDFVKKWILKADNDLKIAKDEIVTKKPTTDMICFHAQQAVEKYLKAFLSFKNKKFRRTHDIAELIELCKEVDDRFKYLYTLSSDELTAYGVSVRYPDDFYEPEFDEAERCIDIAEKTKKFIKDIIPELFC